MKKFFVIAAVFTLVLTASVCRAEVVEVTDSTFYDEAVRTYNPVVVEFYAPWCHYCKEMAGKVDTLSRECAGKVKFVKINTDKNPETTKKYKVAGLPTFVYLKGGEVSGTAIGGMSKDELKKELGLE